MLWITCIRNTIVPLYLVVADSCRQGEETGALSLLRYRRRPRDRLPPIRGRGDDPAAAGLRRVRAALHDLRTSRGSSPDRPQAGRLEGAVRCGQAGLRAREGVQEPSDYHCPDPTDDQ